MKNNKKISLGMTCFCIGALVGYIGSSRLNKKDINSKENGKADTLTNRLSNFMDEINKIAMNSKINKEEIEVECEENLKEDS